MSRRANGEGTIYQLPDGRWRVTVSVRVAGSLKRLSRTRRKRADCVAILPELRGMLTGMPTGDPAGTLGNYLARWLATVVRPHLAANTYEAYERAVRLHVTPRMGNVRLAKLCPLHIEEFKAAMMADRVKPRAAQAAFQSLRAAMTYAVYPLQIIKANPCNGIKVPRHTKRTMRPFEAAEMRLILEDSEGTRWHALYAIAFGCGLRIGELFALEWSDIDWDKGQISVNKQACDHAGAIVVKKPKSKSSIRTVEMPATVKRSLRNHRAIQMQSGLAGCQLLFPTLHGQHLGRANFHSDEWKLRLARCGLAHRGFHNTRHTFATLSLLAGVNAAVVARALGHCSPAITHGVYSHVLPSSEGAAAIAMERLLA